MCICVGVCVCVLVHASHWAKDKRAVPAVEEQANSGIRLFEPSVTIGPQAHTEPRSVEGVRWVGARGASQTRTPQSDRR